MTPFDHDDQSFGRRLGAAFDDVAANERRRIERRATVQRVGLWALAIVLPIAALTWAETQNTEQPDTAATPPVTVPLVEPPPNEPVAPRPPSSSTQTTETVLSDPDGSVPTTPGSIDPGDSAPSPTSPPTTAAPTTVAPPTSAATTAPDTPPSTEAADESSSTTVSSCGATTNLEWSMIGGENGDTARPWGTGVTISAYDAAGEPAAVGLANQIVAVSGGRYGFQIDFDPATGTSERLVFGFETAPCSVEFAISRLETEEYDHDGSQLDEAGRWTAYDANGVAVDSGEFEASALPRSDSDRLLRIELEPGVAAIGFEAVAYGLGAHPEAAPNNSDFAIRSITVD